MSLQEKVTDSARTRLRIANEVNEFIGRNETKVFLTLQIIRRQQARAHRLLEGLGDGRLHGFAARVESARFAHDAGRAIVALKLGVPDPPKLAAHVALEHARALHFAQADRLVVVPGVAVPDERAQVTCALLPLVRFARLGKAGRRRRLFGRGVVVVVVDGQRVGHERVQENGEQSRPNEHDRRSEK